MTFSFFCVLAAGTAAAATLGAEPFAWLEAPAVARSLATLESASAGALATLLLPRAERRSLGGEGEARFMAVFYSSASGENDWAMWLEAGATTAALRPGLSGRLARLGYGPAATPGGEGGRSVQEWPGPRGPLSLFWGDGVIGAAATLERAAATLATTPKPPRLMPARRRLAEHAPSSDLRGEIDVQALYGRLAFTARGRELAGTLDRLGLLDARTLELGLEIDRRRGAAVRAALVLGGEPKGLRGVLGPAIPRARPAAAGAGDALGYLRVSLRPKRLYELTQVVASYHAPLETSLVRTHLESVERRVGKRVGNDALGDAPRVWTVHGVAAPDGPTPVLLAEIEDAQAAAALVAELAPALPVLFPGVSARRRVSGGDVVWVLATEEREFLAVALAGSTLIVATRETTARAYLRPGRGVHRPDGPPRAVAYAGLTHAGVRHLLRSTAWGRGLVAAAAGEGMHLARLLDVLSPVTAEVRESSEDGVYSAAVVLAAP